MPYVFVCFVYNFCLEGDNLNLIFSYLPCTSHILFITIAGEQKMFIKVENEKTVRENAKCDNRFWIDLKTFIRINFIYTIIFGSMDKLLLIQLFVSNSVSCTDFFFFS